MKKIYSYIPAFLMALIFLLVFSWSTSPLYLTYGGDSPFFQIIGLGITQGKVPYVDLFDHKGPVPFFYDALGYSLGLGRVGVFIIQVISLTVAVCIFYRLARLFVSSPRKAAAAVILSFIPLADFITEGNQVEEWQLPFIALSLYLVCSYLLSGKDRHPLGASLVLGLCFGMVFYNRPNDGVMWVGSLYFGLFLLWLARKSYAQILPNIGAFIGGFLIITAPIIAYFAAHNAVPDLFYGMIVHNIRYAGDALFTWGGIGMILIPVIIVGASLLLQKDRKEFRFVLIPMLAFTVILIGKRDYYHYLIPLTPFAVLCFALCLEKGWKKFLWTVCVLFAVFSYREFTFVARAATLRPTLKTFYSQTDALFDNVPYEERNMVWNYNLVTYSGDKKPHLVSLMGTFLHRGLTPSCAVLAAYDLYYLEDTQGIRAKNPKWVVAYPEDGYNKDMDWIEENYDFVAATPSEPVCEIKLYRRKD